MCWATSLFGRSVREGGNIEKKIYGFFRVSTREQNEDRRLIALREIGVPEKNIYLDKQSGKDFNRPQYKKLLRKLKKTICSISKASTLWAEIMKKSWSNGIW